jgi:hypothetical protein
VEATPTGSEKVIPLFMFQRGIRRGLPKHIKCATHPQDLGLNQTPLGIQELLLDLNEKRQ